MNERFKKYHQINLEFGQDTKSIKEYTHTMLTDCPKKIPILFRNTISEIPSTTYGTFSIYKYPAKFIPQVIAYVLKEYAKSGMKVFDPFAGYGTVGVVSRIYGYDYELWDLNPIINVVHDTAVMKRPRINIPELPKRVKNSKEEFAPKWSNLRYWFPGMLD